MTDDRPTTASPPETPAQPGAPARLALGVDDFAAGARLDVFLAERLGASRAQVRRLIARGGVRLDERVQRERDKGRALAAGQCVEVEGFRPPARQQIAPASAAEQAALAVLQEGVGWLVVDKPAGMPVHPLFEEERGTALNAIVARHPGIAGVGEGGLRSGVVHRLDVETSGCLVVATEASAWQRIRDAFQRHRVIKVYRAVVLGDFTDEARVELPLVVGRHRPARVRVAKPGEEGARLVVTTLRPPAALAGATLVEARPTTGFLHQIRATLAHLGHPLAGDVAYGAGREVADPTGAERHLLHASEVAFEDVSARSPDPPDFARVVAGARLCAEGRPSGESGPG